MFTLGPGEWITVFLALVGGGWTLLKIFFGQQKVALDKQYQSVTNMIDLVEKKFEKQLDRMEDTRKGFESDLHALEKAFLTNKAEQLERFVTKMELNSLNDTIQDRFSELSKLVLRVESKMEEKLERARTTSCSVEDCGSRVRK